MGGQFAGQKLRVGPGDKNADVMCGPKGIDYQFKFRHILYFVNEQIIEITVDFVEDFKHIVELFAFKSVFGIFLQDFLWRISGWIRACRRGSAAGCMTEAKA